MTLRTRRLAATAAPYLSLAASLLTSAGCSSDATATDPVMPGAQPAAVPASPDGTVALPVDPANAAPIPAQPSLPTTAPTDQPQPVTSPTPDPSGSAAPQPTTPTATSAPTPAPLPSPPGLNIPIVPTTGVLEVADPSITDPSICEQPGWQQALPSPDNVEVEATFTGGSSTVLAEYDVPAVPLSELRAQYANVIVIAPESHPDSASADLVTDGVEDFREINLAALQIWRDGGGLIYLRAGTYHVGRPAATEYDPCEPKISNCGAGVEKTSRGNIYLFDQTVLKGEGRVGARRTELRLVDNACALNGTSGIFRVKKDHLDGLSKRVFNTTVEDIVINGNRDNQLLIDPSQHTCANGYVPKQDDEKKYGFYAEGENIVVNRVTAMNCNGYGFDPHEHEDIVGSTVSIQNSYSTGNFLDGFTLDAIHQVVVAHNVAVDNDRHGFNIVTGTSDITVCNNVVARNGLTVNPLTGGSNGSGIQVQSGSDPEVPVPKELRIWNNSIVGNYSSGIELRATDSSELRENYVAGNGGSGLRLRGAKNNVVADNITDNNGQVSSTGFEMRLSDYDPDGDGTAFSLSGSEDNAVSGNSFSNAAANFFLTDPGSDANQLSNNTCNGAGC